MPKQEEKKLSDLLAERAPRTRQGYPDTFKAQVCREYAKGDPAAVLHERHGVSKNLVYNWVKQGREGKFDTV